MTTTSPYRHQNYMGEFANDAAALAFVQSVHWDSSLDGLGTPNQGMAYFNTVTSKMRVYDGGSWAEGEAGSVTLDAAYTSGGTLTIDPTGGDLHIQVTEGGADKLRISAGADYLDFTSGGADRLSMTGDLRAITLSSALGISLTAGTDLLLDDQHLTVAIPLSEAGELGLTGFDANSLVGALNELKVEVGAGGATIGASQMIHVDPGRVDEFTPDGTSLWPYAELKDAHDAITDASASKPYVVILAPGRYEGGSAANRNILMESYVWYVGTDRDSVILDASDQISFSSTTGNGLMNLTVVNENTWNDNRGHTVDINAGDHRFTNVLFHINHSFGNDHSLIACQNSGRVQIDRCQFEIYNDASSMTSISCVEAQATVLELEIRDCEFWVDYSGSDLSGNITGVFFNNVTDAGAMVRDCDFRVTSSTLTATTSTSISGIRASMSSQKPLSVLNCDFYISNTASSSSTNCYGIHSSGGLGLSWSTIGCRVRTSVTGGGSGQGYAVRLSSVDSWVSSSDHIDVDTVVDGSGTASGLLTRADGKTYVLSDVVNLGGDLRLSPVGHVAIGSGTASHALGEGLYVTGKAEFDDYAFFDNSVYFYGYAYMQGIVSITGSSLMVSPAADFNDIVTLASDTSGERQLQLDNTGAGTAGSYMSMSFNKATGILDNDVLGQVNFYGNDTVGSDRFGGAMRFAATQDWSGTARGTEFKIYITKQDQATTYNAFSIDSYGRSLFSGDVIPGADDSYSSGLSSYRWSSVFTNDLDIAGDVLEAEKGYGQVTKSTTQTATATWAKVTSWDNPVTFTNGPVTWSGANSRFTVSKDGAYQVSYALPLDTSGTSGNVLQTVVRVNGSITLGSYASFSRASVHSSVGKDCASNSCLLELTANDTVELAVQERTSADGVPGSFSTVGGDQSANSWNSASFSMSAVRLS